MNRATISRMICAIACATAGVIPTPAWGDTINIPLVTVGDPGNVADVTGYGGVSYVYSIGQTDVTTSQYTSFLNSVATTSDAYGLYDVSMGTALPTSGITRSTSGSNYVYNIKGNGSMPVFDVSWGDAARFVNWLQNGQPTTGSETAATTEGGTYALNGGTSNMALLAVNRSTTASWFLPTTNEWYKAAYYVGGGTNAGYWQYPTRSNSAPSNVLSATGTNNANFYDFTTGGDTDPANLLTPVGAFASTFSPYGAYDMGGDVFQWNENEYGGNSRGVRGGSYADPAGDMYYGSNINTPPSGEDSSIGFRVASSLTQTPEPTTFLLIIPACIVFLLKLRTSVQRQGI